MITCPSCGRTVDGEIAEDTPCPQCGTPLLVGKPPELDPEWVAEKAAKAAAHAASPKKSARGAYLVLAIVLAAMIGTIVVMVFQRQPAARGAELGDVELTIVAPKEGTPVIVDGAPAGKTPLVLRMKASSTPIKIIGNNVAIVVTPDRDRTVKLVPRTK